MATTLTRSKEPSEAKITGPGLTKEKLATFGKLDGETFSIKIPIGTILAKVQFTDNGVDVKILKKPWGITYNLIWNHLEQVLNSQS